MIYQIVKFFYMSFFDMLKGQNNGDQGMNSDQIKNNTYQVFGNMANASGDIYNNLQQVQNSYLNNPQQVYQNIMGSYQERFGDALDKNTALASNYNKLSARGIDPNSYAGSYEQNMIRGKMENDAQQNYFNQVLGIQNQGMNLGTSLVNQGMTAGQSQIQGNQADRGLDIQQQLADIEREKMEAEKKKNSFTGNILGSIAGAAGTAIGGTLFGPLGASFGASIGKGLLGGKGYDSALSAFSALGKKN